MAFAATHLIHLGLIGARALTYTEAFWSERTPVKLLPGAVAYAFIVAMAITSFDGPRRWLDRARWTLLHKVGVYVIWLAFVGVYAERAQREPVLWIPAGRPDGGPGPAHHRPRDPSPGASGTT